MFMRYYARSLAAQEQQKNWPMKTTPETGKTPRQLVVEDLEQRIEALEALDDSALGPFTAWDWVICVVGFVLIPALLLWWFA